MGLNTASREGLPDNVPGIAEPDEPPLVVLAES
jgi:hypothetical protein